jgi:hypothetical protein
VSDCCFSVSWEWIREERDRLEGLGEVVGPVYKRAGHHATVNEIEFVVEGPWFFDVIDFESHVWWEATPVSENRKLWFSTNKSG